MCDKFINFYNNYINNNLWLDKCIKWFILWISYFVAGNFCNTAATYKCTHLYHIQSWLSKLIWAKPSKGEILSKAIARYGCPKNGSNE